MSVKGSASPVIVFAIGLVTTTMQFGLAIFAFGGWTAFFRHASLITLAIVTMFLLFAASFSNGNLSSGTKEDRGNRWVFTAFGILALASAIIPPYTDRVEVWTIGGEGVRWAGTILYLLGGALRLWPVFVLGNRFSGLVAIQPSHTLETHGIYSRIRNPSYLGMLVMMFGWGLAFRGWSGFLIAVLLLIPLIARIKSEERLLRAQFGSEYDTYVAQSWRLFPGVY